MKLSGEHIFSEKPRCPHCGVAFDACKATAGGLRGPRPGDVCCCVYCGRFATFDDGLQLRAMTPAEVAGLNTRGAGFPRALTEAGAEEYRAALVKQALREILDQRRDDR